MPTNDSIQEKTVYLSKRKQLGLTREQASELITAQYISPDRLEKIENERLIARADEIVAIADAYNAPELTNYYCRHDCEIGKRFVPEVIPKELPQIAIETVNSLNRLDQIKERLLEIVEDGKITADEYTDFDKIKANLDKIVRSAESLQLWLRQNGLSKE